jgi:hypothetical protein
MALGWQLIAKLKRNVLKDTTEDDLLTYMPIAGNVP